MSKYRRAAKIDKNQQGIVGALRNLPGVSVELNHDDILVGYNLQTYWFEVKAPDCANKAGKVFESAIKPDQKRIRRTWTGHYAIVTTYDEILEIIGYPVG